MLQCIVDQHTFIYIIAYFEQEVNLYQNALKTSGYNNKLEFQKPEEKGKKKKKRKVLWFNPPFSRHVTTPVGKYFFSIHRAKCRNL